MFQNIDPFSQKYAFFRSITLAWLFKVRKRSESASPIRPSKIANSRIAGYRLLSAPLTLSFAKTGRISRSPGIPQNEEHPAVPLRISDSSIGDRNLRHAQNWAASIAAAAVAIAARLAICARLISRDISRKVPRRLSGKTERETACKQIARTFFCAVAMAARVDKSSG